ncbi:MAG: hypothetical protein IT360_25885, partial [Gemmatimonadaceae bacterium]|nr:hypothetical protein [Gemmatimonadaceae bacterium]
MTADERERLAELIADEVRRALGRADAQQQRAAPWLVPPVRPAPPGRTGDAPAWSGAAQSLGDVAPVRRPSASTHRADPGAMTAAVRAAAAGQGPTRAVPLPAHAHEDGASHAGASARPTAAGIRRRPAGSVEVPVAVSRRHLHVSPEHARALFGLEPLEVHRRILQPGQFAARQRVDVVGPNGRLDCLRVVGPTRAESQLELSRRDAAQLGIDPPLAASGTLHTSAGGLTLVGPHGRVELGRGVILAARHLHLSPADGARWGMRDGDRVDLRCGDGARATTWHDVLVRCGPGNATELHLDEDEANAAAVNAGSLARLVGLREGDTVRRRLITEQEVIVMARRGQAIPHGALLTPGARDRARTLGL